MAFAQVNNVAVRGISGCVPSQVEENISLPFYSGPEEASKVIEATGIERRHVTPEGTTASDLCQRAADRLLADLGWEKDSVDLIAFCTQMPDYLNHPNSFVVHEALGLPETTICLDFFHGCPGWVNTLYAVSQIVSAGQIKRAILLDGDTVSQWQNRQDRESVPLFGDAGTATALEFDSEAPLMYFNIGTKSDDGSALATRDGAMRHPFTMETFTKHLLAKQGKLSVEEADSRMDSMDVFSFAITKVPKAIKKLCAEYAIDIPGVDNLVLHQANKMIVETIAKRLKMPSEKVVLGLRNYGNTTSASVPMAIVTECGDKMRTVKQKNLVCGFGTGLAWAAAYFETDKIVCPEIIEL